MHSIYRMATLSLFLVGSNTSAFFIKWPWSFVYPGSSAATVGTAVGAATINYGFLRPTILLPVTTAAPTTTTTTTTTARPTTPIGQFLINALLASAVNLPATSNNSLLISLANALANRPVVGGIAQPYPVVGGGGTGIFGGIGGIAQAPSGVVGGIAAPPSFGGAVGGIAAPPSLGGFGGGFVLPNGFPAAGGVISSGLLPGYFPGGISGRSSKGGREIDSGNSGKVIFDSSRKRK